MGGESKNESSEDSSSPSTIHQQQAKLIRLDGRGTIQSVAFFADGKHIVSSGEELRIRRWRVEDGTEAGAPMDAGNKVGSIAVSRNGRWIVSGTDRGKVTVWNAESHEEVTAFEGHKSWVKAVDVSPDGTKIATGSLDSTVCVWSLSTGERLLGPLTHDDGITAVKFSPDGRLIATAVGWPFGSVRLYDSLDGCLRVDVLIRLPVFPRLTEVLAWISDSTQLYVLSSDGNVNCLDVSTGTTRSQWPIQHSSQNPRCIVPSSNGAFIAAATDSSVSFWDTTTHKQIGTVIQYSGHIETMAVSAIHDLALGGEKTITLRSLRGVLPSSYLDDIRPVGAEKFDLEETIKSLRAQKESQNRKIACLEEVVQQLGNQLSDSQHRADKLSETTECLYGKITRLEQQFRTYEQKHQCEALYAEGRILDAAVSLLEITNIVSSVGANALIMDWVATFKSLCIPTLETIGDEALSAEKQDEAIAAYSTALLLGPSTPNTILIKWANTVLIRSSANDALAAAAKFNVPKFVICKVICSVLEEGGRISEAVKCFQQLQSELGEDTSSRDEQAQSELVEGFQRRRSDATHFFHATINALDREGKSIDETEWLANFKARCLKTLEQRGDVAMDSASYRDAVDHYTTALILDPLSTDLLTKRSKAQAGIGSWKDSLEDADAAIGLDPSSPRGYERRHAALLGTHRYDEAIDAYGDMLLKLEQSPDPVIRGLRNRYVSPSRTLEAIRHSVKRTQRGAPHVLIDTGTGRLYDQVERTDEFEADPKFKALVASTTTVLDNSRITQIVQQFFGYATFSHTWEGAEPLFHDVLRESVHKLAESPTVFKLVMFCRTVQEAGLRWAWSDTCCINKTDGSVLQESLTSMFQWYHESTLTIIHLKGVRSDSELGALIRSLWNTRAWTLQEFFASRAIRFYTEDWKPYLPHESVYNHKDSSAIMGEMAAATGVDVQVLLALRPGSENVRQKLRLAAARTATKQEDTAYSLFGIFDVSIPVTYGEGQERALGRLLQEVLTRSGDVSILAWTGKASDYNSCLPTEIGVYREPVSPYIPSPLEDDEMNTLVAELRTSSRYLDSTVMLYDRVVHLPSPRLVSRRLSLSCIVFPLKGPMLSSSGSQHVYCATISALGNVEIKTTEDLSSLNELVLVHPWLQCLLDPALPSEDVFADDDADAPTPDADVLSPFASHIESPPSDKLTRALRLFARLRQPFGALLLVPLSHTEYKRVASDQPIVVQLLKGVLPRHLARRIRTLDIL